MSWPTGEPIPLSTRKKMSLASLRGPNKVRHRHDGVTEVYLTQGKVELVDTADWPLLSRYRWYAVRSSKPNSDIWYVRAALSRIDNPRGRHVFMHSVLLPNASQIDHWDGDGLNNRRYNIRQATYTQNMFNHPVVPHSSKYTGVARHGDKWQAYIAVEGVLIYLGRYATEKLAAGARRQAEQLFYPDFPRCPR